MLTTFIKNDDPNWRDVSVQPALPDELLGLNELAQNLWWCWNYDAKDLFKSMDEKLWEETRNPIRMLKELTYERYVALKEDHDFKLRYNSVYRKFKEYMNEASPAELPKIAYFSMEYGLNDTVKIYSGGLGILAGDYMKEASDYNYPMVGVGLLYKYGYFTQQLSVSGEQIAGYYPQDFGNVPVQQVKDKDGNKITIQVNFPGRTVYAAIWKVQIGRIPLYLLDTNIPENSPEDQGITDQLYGGDNENRLKQELILGVGGKRALDALGIKQQLYHLNEGHAAFTSLERMNQLINNDGFSFEEAIEIVRASSLCTTHTPVPAGHDYFNEQVLLKYMGHYPDRLHITWDQFYNLGLAHPGQKHELFSMSYLATRMSQEVNGVSELHGEVTRTMFKELWKGYAEDELYIGHVTNGVHYPTWTAKPWRDLYESTFDKDFFKNQSDSTFWRKIYDIKDEDIWSIRTEQRGKLINYLRERVKDSWDERQEDPRKILEVIDALNPEALTIGFARRFATYKRGTLLFSDLERLKTLVCNPERPVQFIFAGKAHPADKAGQDMIRYIVEISKRPEFYGKILFIENYDMDLAQKLLRGVDVWLNNPTRPLEASGTSGMKGIMNGVLNLSVLDGWWVEGYREDAGWGLAKEKTYASQTMQNHLDAETIYRLLESDVIPKFYTRNSDAIPSEWVRMVKNSIAHIAPMFTTKRMMDDYNDRFYSKLQTRSNEMEKENYAKAREISAWKKEFKREWDKIELVDYNDEALRKDIQLGERSQVRVVIDLKTLDPSKIGVEFVLNEKHEGSETQDFEVQAMELERTVGTISFYTVSILPKKSGSYSYSVRVFPKNTDLPHRQDFPLVKWI
jgi:alpha-glucan phosphorylase-like protein